MTSLKRLSLAAVAVTALLAGSQLARAASYSLTLGSANQHFGGVVSMNGSFGSSLLLPPVVQLPPASIVLNGSPHSVGALPGGSSQTLFDISGSQLNDIQNLNVSFLTPTAPAAQTPTLLSVPTPGDQLFFKKIGISLSEVVTDLTFHQTGAAQLSPTGAATGNYSLPGTFTLSLAERQVSFIGIAAYVLPAAKLTLDGNLAGAYAVSGPEGDPRVNMTGSLFLPYPMNYVTGDPPVTLLSTVTVAAGYNLDWNPTAVIPEPASFTLLGVALLGLAPVVRRWRRR